MSLLSKVISNLFNGVSQQPAELRDPSHAALQLNAVSSPAYGLRKRPGTTHVAKLAPVDATPLVHFVNRDKNEQFAVTVTPGALKVFDAQSGAEMVVNTPHGTEYLRGIDPQTDLKLVTVADHTFVLNTQRVVQLQGELLNDADSLEGIVSFPVPTPKLPIVEPADSTKTPAPGSTYTPPPSWGGGGGGGGGGGTDPTPPTPGEEDPKPEDPSTPPEEPKVKLSLAAATLPEARVGWPYFYDFSPLLTIEDNTGDYYYGSSVWSASGVPDGLTFNGKSIKGDPTSKTSGSVSITATYRGVSVTNTYSITVKQVVPMVKDPSTGQWPDPAATDGSKVDNETDFAWQLSNLTDPFPEYLGDGDLMGRLRAQGLDGNHYLVLYRPSLTLTVKGDPGASDLTRYFPAGVSQYGGANNQGNLGSFANVLLSGLQNDKYSVVTNYIANLGYTNESFPQMTLRRTPGLTLGAAVSRDVMTTGSAVVYSGTPAQVLNAVAFDAEYIIPTNGRWVVDGDGKTTLVSSLNMEILPVRVGFTGVVTGAPSPDDRLDLVCGHPSKYYRDGSLLYNPKTFENSTFIQGFTLEYHRYVVTNTNPLQKGMAPTQGLSFEAVGIPYAKDMSWSAFRPTFNTPMAYRIVPKLGLTKAILGPYVSVYKLYYDNSLIGLSNADWASIP